MLRTNYHQPSKLCGTRTKKTSSRQTVSFLLLRRRKRVLKLKRTSQLRSQRFQSLRLAKEDLSSARKSCSLFWSMAKWSSRSAADTWASTSIPINTDLQRWTSSPIEAKSRRKTSIPQLGRARETKDAQPRRRPATTFVERARRLKPCKIPRTCSSNQNWEPTRSLPKRGKLCKKAWATTSGVRKLTWSR